MTKNHPIHLIILREELDRRTRINTSYSLRSFAKQLDIDASLLSKILQGSRPLSMANAVKIMERIQLNPDEKNLFWQSLIKVREESVKFDPYAQIQAKTPSLNEGKLLDQELFQMIAEPHHYMIVELTRVKSFQGNVPWISEILGMPKEEVKAAIDRLIKVGLLQVEGKKISRAPGRHTTKDKTITAPAFKYHQRKILEKAILALDNVPLEKRNQSSMTIAINPAKIPLAKKMIQDFVDQLSDVLEAGPLEEVYQMSFSLFPLTQVEKDATAETSAESYQ